MPLGHVALAVLVVASQPPAPTAVAAPPTARRPANAGAMFEFLLARRAEAAEDVKTAESAFERAVALDPTSAELRAELAGFYARQNRADDAVAAAERALVLDAESEEGHRILGLVQAAWADGVIDGPAGGTEVAWRSSAIQHLQKVQASPAMATDLGLQVTLARQLLSADRARDAVPLLERVVAQTRPDGEPASMLAEALRALGEFARATSVLEQAAAANPRYFMALGDIHERQGQFEEAADAFDKGAKAIRGPGRELRLRRVNALLSLPKGEGAARAITALGEHLATTPKDAAASYLLAKAHLQRGNASAAITAARQVLDLEPRHLPTLALIAAHHREQYDFAAVVAWLAPFDRGAAAADEPKADRVRLFAELAGARQQLGDGPGAVAAFEKARELMPESAPLAEALATAYLQVGRHNDARRVARAARSGGADDLGLVRVEALAGIRGGGAAEAVRAAETAVGARRGEVDGAFTLADIYQEAKRHTDALAVLAPLATALPDDDRVALRVATAHEAAGRIADAERAIRSVVARDPLNAPALNALGYMLANRGLKVPEALTLVDRALVVEPTNPAYLDSRGWALFKLGRVAEAEAPLVQAATALAGSSVIQFHLAEVLAALGKRAEAAARLERALAGDMVDIDRATLERRLAALGRRR